MATTKQYLDQLIIDKSNLVKNLNTMKVSASDTETFTSLVPKVLNVESYPDGDNLQYGVIKDKHTLLLLHANDFTDSSMYNVPITNNGVTISATQSKFGGKSFYFNGKANLLFNTITAKMNFNKEFTLDWWEYKVNTEGNFAPSFYMENGSKGLIVLDNLDTYRFFGGDSSWSWATYTDPFGSRKLNQWVHLAIVRQGSQVIIYENGKNIASFPLNGNITMTNKMYAGFRSGQYGGYFTGYMDEIRSSDVARWTSDFTPPTKPYSNIEGADV